VTNTRARVAIVGASGYTGLNLLRIVLKHPRMTLVACVSPSFAGKPVASLYPHFRPKIAFTGHSSAEIAALAPDLVFTATPNGEPMRLVPLLPASTKVVDLAADYRFADRRVWERVYGMKHADRRRRAVYGLPEINRDAIRAARVVGNPGCYVTSALLAALPFVRAGLVERVVFDGKSGYSGAGRGKTFVNDPANYTDNVLAYKLDFHRHRPEIEQVLGMRVSFTPQVIPTFRGILMTAHLFLAKRLSTKAATALARRFYAGEPFVRVDADRIPTLHDVQGTNLAALGGFEQDPTGRMVVVSVLDNLLKGAAGQAVQNANLMLGFPETTGLEGVLAPKTKA
jgi:N-acetyl-gamma-glutamyl-phosphate reductase